MNQMKLHRSDLFVTVELVFNKVMSIIFMSLIYAMLYRSKERGLEFCFLVMTINDDVTIDVM